ncbi:MAG: dihydropyrimidinase [Sphaerochaetaceae bacterium]
MRQILITGALIVDSYGSQKSDLLIEGEKIRAVAPSLKGANLSEDVEIVDATGLYIMPGLIDAHTHYNLISRNSVTADGFYEGSQLAAFGGVTTVIDFADDDKKSPLKESAAKRTLAMETEMAIDFALHQGVYKVTKNLGNELKELAHSGITAIKIFTTYKEVGYLIEEELLEDLFKSCKENNILVTVHCEDNKLLEEINTSYKGDYKIEDHPVLRPPASEYLAIKKMGRLAKKYDMPIYIVHLSSELGIKAVRELRADSTKVVVETTPHYLLLDNSLLRTKEGSLYLMTPPLRTKEDNLALQQALAEGQIDIIATDHCSFTKEQKSSENNCTKVLPGIPGTEELLPLVYTLVVDKLKLGESKVVDLLSTKVAKVFGLYPNKGSLKVGTDADLILFDPKIETTISFRNLHSKANYTAYENFKVRGKVVRTYLRGNLITDAEKFRSSKGTGKFIKASVSDCYGI